MISIKVSCLDGSVSGAEIRAGSWVTAPEEFADFFDEFVLPESFTVLGGTVSVESNWYSSESFERAEMFIKVAQRYLDREFSPLMSPITVDMVGVEPLKPEVVPAGTVF